MSYTDTFIKIAEDCPSAGEVPPQKPKPTKAQIEFALLIQAPYSLDHKALTHAVHKAPKGQDALGFDAFHSKGQPCLRASPLTKRYGWGAHYNAEGRIAIYAAGSREYVDICASAGKTLLAMRNKRK